MAADRRAEISSIALHQQFHTPIPVGKFYPFRPISSEELAKIDLDYSHDNIPVNCFSADGKLLYTFANFNEAGDKLGIHTGGIRRILRGKQTDTYNLRFAYAPDSPGMNHLPFNERKERIAR